MAKKKVKKEVVIEKKEICTSETEVARLESLVMEFNNQLRLIGERIDRIVDAIDKSKKVKGL